MTHNSEKAPALGGHSGFTLVELAIVLMIAGVLIAGVLKGKQLLENARLQKTVAQVNEIASAYDKFIDLYHEIPGDMPNADKRLPNCQAGNGYDCVNGNGDRALGTIIDGWGHPGDSDATITDENSQFWKHLALTGLINGVETDASSVKFGVSSPKAPLRGGFYAFQIDQASYSQQKLEIRIQSKPDAVFTTPGHEPLTPHEAFWIDKKMDDGISNTGSVLTYGQNVNGAALECIAYNETVTGRNCLTGFLIPRKK